MKKIFVFVLLLLTVTPAFAVQENTVKDVKKTVSASDKKAQFKARRKRVEQLIKKYKKAPKVQQPAIKEELSAVVSEQVDEQISYMKNRIADERANLDNWETKIKADEANLIQVKAKRVEDLLSGAAKQKQKAAKKAWKQQMRKLKK